MWTRAPHSPKRAASRFRLQSYGFVALFPFEDFFTGLLIWLLGRKSDGNVAISALIRWDEKAGLQRDAIRCSLLATIRVEVSIYSPSGHSRKCLLRAIFHINPHFGQMYSPNAYDHQGRQTDIKANCEQHYHDGFDGFVHATLPLRGTALESHQAFPGSVS
jgi:hypothetical protein